MANYQGEQFGQRRPPLSVTIKSILERYPEWTDLQGKASLGWCITYLFVHAYTAELERL